MLIGRWLGPRTERPTRWGRIATGHLRPGFGCLPATLLGLVFLLWLLGMHGWGQRLAAGLLVGLCPGVQWRVGTVGLGLPLMLWVKEIEGRSLSNPSMAVLRVDRLEVRPDPVASLREGALWIRYHLEVGAGTVDGRAGQRPHNEYAVHGTVRSLQLTDVPLFSHGLRRKVQGSVSASFEGEGRVGRMDACRWKARLKIEQGSLELVRPVLRHWLLPFSQVRMLLYGEGRRIAIQQGTITSVLGEGWLNGVLHLETEPVWSWLDIRGGIRPDPAFFQGSDNTVALQAIRVQLIDKPLLFNLSGTLLHPGIHFENLAMQMHALEEESQ